MEEPSRAPHEIRPRTDTRRPPPFFQLNSFTHSRDRIDVAQSRSIKFHTNTPHFFTFFFFIGGGGERILVQLNVLHSRYNRYRETKYWRGFDTSPARRPRKEEIMNSLQWLPILRSILRSSPRLPPKKQRRCTRSQIWAMNIYSYKLNSFKESPAQTTTVLYSLARRRSFSLLLLRPV